MLGLSGDFPYPLVYSTQIRGGFNPGHPGRNRRTGIDGTRHDRDGPSGVFLARNGFKEAAMRRRDIAAWAVCLILASTTTSAQAQASDAAARAKLRARIAAQRAEVELLRMEHEADAANLKEVLGDLRTLEDREAAPPGVAEIMAAQGVGDVEAERLRKVDAEINASKLKALRPLVERKTRDFSAKTTALLEKSLELEDLERQYREPAPAAELGANPAPATGLGIPILDPVPGDPTANCCTDPPTEDEVWAKVAGSASAPTDRKGARFAVEKVGEKVDPCKVYPLAGPCELVHCHYKATVTFPGAYRTEVVYLDKDHLRGCVVASHGHAVRAEQGVVRVALPASDSDLERRMARMEETLDRLRKAFDGASSREER
jgi:hypothetical protein